MILPIIISIIVSLVLGMLWYGKLFRKPYMRIMKAPTDPDTIKAGMKDMWKLLAVQAVLSLMFLYTLISFF